MKKFRIFPIILSLLLLVGCAGQGGDGTVLTVTDENFDTEVLSSDKTVLLDFYADWCGPCKQVAPIVEEIAAERTDIKVGKIDVDAETALAARFNVVSIPLLVVMKDGEIVDQHLGACSKDVILEMLE